MQSPPSVSPSRYLLLNHWTKSNQILVCELLHESGAQRHIFFASPPGALERNQKVKYHYISITKSISNIFKPNFVCFLTNESNTTYQTGFLFRRQGHVQGVGLVGVQGCWGSIVISKFNQIWCVSYSHEWHV